MISEGDSGPTVRWDRQPSVRAGCGSVAPLWPTPVRTTAALRGRGCLRRLAVTSEAAIRPFMAEPKQRLVAAARFNPTGSAREAPSVNATSWRITGIHAGIQRSESGCALARSIPETNALRRLSTGMHWLDCIRAEAVEPMVWIGSLGVLARVHALRRSLRGFVCGAAPVLPDLSSGP